MEIIKTHDLRKVYNIGDVCVVALKNNSFITNPDAAVEASASQQKNLISILGCIVQSDSEQHWFSAECFSALSNEQRDQAKEQAHMLVFLKFHLLRNASSPEKFLMPLLQPAIPDDVLRKRATELIVQLGLEKKTTATSSLFSENQVLGSMDNDQKTTVISDERGEIPELFQTLNTEGKTKIFIFTKDRYANRLIGAGNGAVEPDSSTGSPLCRE